MRHVEKYCRPREATDDNTAHAHCMLDTIGYRLNLEYVIFIGLPGHQWLCERVPVLRYTYFNLVLYSNPILNCFYNTCNTGIPCARQHSNFKFYVLERPDDDLL
jgi:hypothetical protein